MVNPQRETERLEYFSDAVIAIAATLLSVDLKAPRADVLSGTTLLEALVQQWPSYLAFAVSFLFIGISWAAHHDMFNYVRRTNHMMLILNLMFLMGIALQPFSTALLAEHIGKDGERTAAMVFYGVLLLTSVSYNAVWHYAIRCGLIEDCLDARLLRALSIEHAVAPLLHLSALLVAFWSVRLSLIPVLMLYVFFALPRVAERLIVGSHHIPGFGEGPKQ
ncbi:TMEM175 family protein [Anatilimnocola floriformis]|uniref:TMEM175 family protein n=1 Tax=Anatilimnocola floriformis TaxID=2948575 RepID=UPI0020C52490|nr:TMEM175 family protein [Anatilimnocola floriformis]